MRRGIETSFTELKYAIRLTHFHAKKLNPEPLLDSITKLQKKRVLLIRK